MPKRVLVVDDDESTRRFLTVALEENGYEAVTAEDGDDGLKKVQESPPDLILLDVMMPKKTGFTLFKQLRKTEEYKNIPVIMLTGVAGALEEDEERAEVNRQVADLHLRLKSIESKVVELKLSSDQDAEGLEKAISEEWSGLSRDFTGLSSRIM